MYYGKDLWNKELTADMIEVNLSNSKTICTYPELPKTLYNVLCRAAGECPYKTAIIDNFNRSYTYRDFLSSVDYFAGYLKEYKHVTRHTRVAIMLYNSFEFCVVFFALSKLGAVTVPLPTKFKQQEIMSLLDKADVQHIVCDVNYQDWFTEYESKGISLTLSQEGKAGYGFGYLPHPYADYNYEGEFEDDAVLMFTSGTTSQSKGVIIKNYNLMHAIASYQRILGITDEDSSVIATPIYHVTGLIALLGLFVYTKASLHLHKFFDAKRVLSTIAHEKLTFIHASPTVFSLLLTEKAYYPRLPSLRKLACGSSNMPIEKIKQLHQWLPQSAFHTIYGLTETSSPATIFPVDAATSKYIGSSGLPIPGTVFKIVDENCRELPNETIGEILIKGSVILDHYYNLSTDSLNTEGWLSTGDLGYFNSEGYLYIVDRKKDIINRGGEKICSIDVENALYQIEGIQDAAVVGIPDDVYGEVAAAVVTLSDNYVLTENAIQEQLRHMIAKYKIPTRIKILDKIPITPNSKVDKRYIRQMFH